MISNLWYGGEVRQLQLRRQMPSDGWPLTSWLLLHVGRSMHLRVEVVMIVAGGSGLVVQLVPVVVVSVR